MPYCLKYPHLHVHGGQRVVLDVVEKNRFGRQGLFLVIGLGISQAHLTRLCGNFSRISITRRFLDNPLLIVGSNLVLHHDKALLTIMETIDKVVLDNHLANIL